MKRRILAMMLAIAMIASILVGYTVSAATFDGATVAYSQDFEAEDSCDGWEAITREVSTDKWGTDSAVAVVGSGWPGKSPVLISDCSASDEYTIIFKKKGYYEDWYWIKFASVDDNSWGAGEQLGSACTDWTYFAYKVSGYSEYKLYMCGQAYAIDDVLVLKGDYLDACNAWIADNSQANPYDLLNVEEPEATEAPTSEYVFYEDFEDAEPFTWSNQWTNAAFTGTSEITAEGGYNGGKGYKFQSTEGSFGNWVTNTFVDNLDASKKYKITFKAYGDISVLRVLDSSKNTLSELVNIGSGLGTLTTSWNDYSCEFTGATGLKFYLKEQGTSYNLDVSVFIDEIVIVEVVDEPTEAPVEATEEPVEPTEEPVVPTEEPVVPTEEPTPEPTPAPLVNLIKNGDFSNGTTHWDVSSLGSYSIEDEAFNSTKVFKIPANAGGNLIQAVSVVPGATYTLKYNMHCQNAGPNVSVYSYNPLSGQMSYIRGHNWAAQGDNMTAREQVIDDSSAKRSEFISAEGDMLAIVFPSTGDDFYIDDVQLIGPAPAEDKKAEQMYGNMLIGAEWKYENEAGVSIDDNDVIMMSKTYDAEAGTWTECSSYVYKYAKVIPGRKYVGGGFKMCNQAQLFNMELWTVDENGELVSRITDNNWMSTGNWNFYAIGQSGKSDDRNNAYTVPEGVYGIAVLGRAAGGSYEETTTVETSFKDFGLYDVTESYAFAEDDIPTGTGATVDGKNITVVVDGAEATLDISSADGSRVEYYADADCTTAISATVTGLDTEDKVVYAKVYSYLNARYRVYTVTVKSKIKMLADGKVAAKEALEKYKDPADYRKAQQAELATLIEAGKASIDTAESLEMLETLIATAEAELDKVLTDAEVYGVLLAYDSFDSEAGTALQERAGDLNTTGDIQNAPTEGYVVDDANPLTYPGLVTKGNYGIGGHAYVTGAFKINTGAEEIAPYLSDDNWGIIGKTGTTIWTSMLMRNDQNDGWGMIVGSQGWHQENGIKFGKTGLSNDYISMHVGSNHENTTISDISDVAISKDTVLYVFKYEFVSATSTKISCWINPKLGKEPTGEPDMQITTEDFRGIGTIKWYPGSGNNNGSIDEIRVATGYEAVAPLADGTELYSEDFEGDTSSWQVLNGNGVDINEDTEDVEGQQQPKETTSWGIVEDYNNPDNKALVINDTSWGVFRTQVFMDGLNIDSDYTMVLRVAGDAGWLGLTHDGHWNPSAMICSVDENKTPTPAYTGITNKWKTYAVKFTGMEMLKFTGQVQAASGVMNGNLYIDDIKIYAGDVVDDMKTDIAELEQAKTDAAAALDAYKAADDYRDDQKTELANAIAAGKKAIENAQTEAAVDKAVEDAKKAIDDIKTDAQLTAEELQKAKDDAKAALDSYKSADDYRDAEKTTLADAITAGKAAIDACTVIDDVATALTNAKAVMDEIKTDAEYVAEELADAKEEAKAALDTYKNPDDYRDAQKEELAQAIEDAKAAIDEATDIAGVESALATAKGSMDEIKTDAQLKEEEAANATPTPDAGETVAPTPGTDSTPGVTTTPGTTNQPGVTVAPTASPTTTPSAKPTPAAKKVKKVRFVKKKIKVKVGKKATLKVKLTPKKLSKAAKKVKWSIDKKGKKVVKFVKKAKKLRGKLKVKIKAKKKGKAKITCKAPSGKKAVCKITVK